MMLKESVIRFILAFCVFAREGDCQEFQKYSPPAAGNIITNQMKQFIMMSSSFTNQTIFYPQRRVESIRRQRVFPPSYPFPCANSTDRGRSFRRPTSVHRLRPGDIDVVGAMGDSLVAGNGALEEYAIGTVIEYRGVSWCAGGEGTWRQYLTLPNILKEFNPNLKGYSRGKGEFLSQNSGMNVAFPVSADADALTQAKYLVKKMKTHPDIDFFNDWKMITIFFGANDLCSSQCFNKEGTSAIQHKRKLMEALDYLYENMPRTFVNLIPVLEDEVKSGFTGRQSPILESDIALLEEERGYIASGVNQNNGGHYFVLTVSWTTAVRWWHGGLSCCNITRLCLASHSGLFSSIAWFKLTSSYWYPSPWLEHRWFPAAHKKYLRLETHVTVSVRQKRSMMCRFLHRLFCTCFHTGSDVNEFDIISQLVLDYQDAEKQLIKSGRYDAKEDFTVVLQPFMTAFNAPVDKAKRYKPFIDKSYITYDCFHFSQKGHALGANMLWNNLLEPVGKKSKKQLDYIMQEFRCPTNRAPYFFTNINSKVFLTYGTQIYYEL